MYITKIRTKLSRMYMYCKSNYMFHIHIFACNVLAMGKKISLCQKKKYQNVKMQNIRDFKWVNY